MKKQEKIQEAYGEYWEAVKSFVDTEDGWCTDKYYNKIDCPLPKGNIEYESKYIRVDDGERMVDVYQWRPKSLQGIEDNNGWIKVGEDNIIPYDGDLWGVMKNGDIFSFSENDFIAKGLLTHYQPIIKPQLPII